MIVYNNFSRHNNFNKVKNVNLKIVVILQILYFFIKIHIYNSNVMIFYFKNCQKSIMSGIVILKNMIMNFTKNLKNITKKKYKNMVN